MKKAKLFLGAIAVIAIVGGTVAARSANRVGFTYYYSNDNQPNDCTLQASYNPNGIATPVTGTFVTVEGQGGLCSPIEVGAE